jgi:hypothetical protein
MCGVYKPTNVISLSYGGQESDVPISYQKRQCLEYMKLGLQGVSFLFASGDSGVSSKSSKFSAKALTDLEQTILVPSTDQQAAWAQTLMSSIQLGLALAPTLRAWEPQKSIPARPSSSLKVLSTILLDTHIL